ncbi:tetratricopeptide repeat protein [Nocardia sp. NPDC051832]|uniref:serine/threonine-protein kinase n=1 Tax=Nocardia sp. NPDC051832 TaxID=3155673 RepID=UPI00343BDC87
MPEQPMWVSRTSPGPGLPPRRPTPWAKRTSPDTFRSAEPAANGVATGSGRTAGSRPIVRRLGGGLVPAPRVPSGDPRSVLLTDPEVPERKRFCWKCQDPVGRRAGEVTGVCPRCAAPFHFRPQLRRGEVVADQYEIQGCIAHGGLGWIYLAVDRNVSDRWVVLKGLQNPLDFEAHVVALAERQFLSEVACPGIVKIYNFVKHGSTRDIADGYIVMEYVGGRSLKSMLEHAAPERIPVAEALAYLMEVLPAFDYLHAAGLAYNDLKPDNMMVNDDGITLIDLGAVAALDSYGSIYGTPGYQAPEITRTGPTVASDLYMVGRTLAVLILEPPADRADGFPDLDGQPVLRRYPALHRLLVRATAAEPDRRFPSAHAMYNQLAGVLRAVLAAESGREHPQISMEFGALRGDFGIDTLIGPTDGITDGRTRTVRLQAADVAAALPVPLIDSEDPSAELLAALLHTEPRHALDAAGRTRDRVDGGIIGAPETFDLECGLVEVRAELDLGAVDTALARLARLRAGHENDWRIVWYTGVCLLLDHNHRAAYEQFDIVHAMLPGELAPLLALAATAELVLADSDQSADGELWRRAAGGYYRSVWRTNHGVVSAAFGSARCLAADGDLPGAVAVLDEVPLASRHHGVASLTGCLLLITRPVEDLQEAELAAAAGRLAALADEPRSLQMRVLVIGAALEWLRLGRRPVEPILFGHPCTEPGLGNALESSLRALARGATDRIHRYRLVDLANHVRPRTWW